MFLKLLLSLLVSGSISFATAAPARDFKYEIIISAPVGTQFEGRGGRMIAKCDGKPITFVSYDEMGYVKKYGVKTQEVRAGRYKVGYTATVSLKNCNELVGNQEISYSFKTQHLANMDKKIRKIHPSSIEKDILGSRTPDYGDAVYQKADIEKNKYEGKAMINLDGTPLTIGSVDGGEFRLSVIRR